MSLRSAVFEPLRRFQIHQALHPNPLSLVLTLPFSDEARRVVEGSFGLPAYGRTLHMLLFPLMDTTLGLIVSLSFNHSILLGHSLRSSVRRLIKISSPLKAFMADHGVFMSSQI
jgi:hypothetical protein